MKSLAILNISIVFTTLTLRVKERFHMLWDKLRVLEEDLPSSYLKKQELTFTLGKQIIYHFVNINQRTGDVTDEDL